MPSAGAVEYLRVTDLHAFYDESHILHGIDFTVYRGEMVALLGRNGAGRTTTLRSILGLVGKRSGSIMVNGREVVHWPTHRIARLGVGYCPEERGIFSSLTAEENLMLPPGLTSEGMSLEEIYTIFPNLKERRHSQGTRLSGGEQQMLAMARILRAGARLLLLDEVSEGLAPVIVQKLSQVIQGLKATWLYDSAGRAELPLRLQIGRPNVCQSREGELRQRLQKKRWKRSNRCWKSYSGFRSPCHSRDCGVLMGQGDPRVWKKEPRSGGVALSPARSRRRSAG